MLQKRRIGGELVRRNGRNLRSSFAKVFGQKVVQLGVVTQWFRQIFESRNDLVKRAYGRTVQIDQKLIKWIGGWAGDRTDRRKALSLQTAERARSAVGSRPGNTTASRKERSQIHSDTVRLPKARKIVWWKSTSCQYVFQVRVKAVRFGPPRSTQTKRSTL